MLDRSRPTVSIIIKALNEERHIEDTIDSALAVLEGMKGEVILADSASTDQTIELAKLKPIKIVRMENIGDRSCGAGAQLGYQYCSGRFICLIDGDMRMRDGFLPAAIQFLEEHPDFAGVGGMTSEREMSNIEYVRRNARKHEGHRPGPVKRLDGGGVYRRSAIESVGHLTDRNLHGGEELELGARLTARGWKLTRLAIPDVDHFGHTGSAYRLLLQRWIKRTSSGIGEVLRAAVGKYHFLCTLQQQSRVLILMVLVHLWWASLLAVPILIGNWLNSLFATLALACFPIIVMSLRFRSVRIGVYSVVAWNIHALSFWPGFLRHRVSPTDWISSTIVHDASGQIPVARQKMRLQ